MEEIPILLETALVSNKLLKCSIIMMIEMYKTDMEGEINRVETFPFRAQAFVIRPFNNFKAQVSDALEMINESVGEFLYQVRIWKMCANDLIEKPLPYFPYPQ